MKVVIGGKEITLKPEDVAVARDATNALIASVKDVSVSTNRPELYFTLIVYMYMKATQTIDAITPDAMKYILDMLNIMQENRTSIKHDN